MTVYKSIVAYDGTDFQGFQRLGPGQRTVQGTLEAGLRRIGWTGSSLTAAGRTDGGVHARGQVVAFNLDWRHDCASLTHALNSRLPADVAVWDTETAPPGFHPRFSASSRRYSYALIVSPQPDPLRERYAWRVWPEVDLGAMQGEAQALLGHRDFAAFGRAPIAGGHTMRTVLAAGWRRLGDGLEFDIEADAFLQHMVRRIVAALVGVGQGRREAGVVCALLGSPGGRWEGPMAPARGLCLEKVTYGRDAGGAAASVEQGA